MDFTGDLYNAFGVTGPQYLAIGALVAVLLAGAVAATVLEAARVWQEYTLPAPAAGDRRNKPALLAENAEKIDITRMGHIAAQQAAKGAEQPPLSSSATAPAQPAVPPTDVVKGTLPDSMKAIVTKYGLEWLTMASSDGLVIASTSATPDEDAAVYSNLFFELYRTRPEPYFNVSNKDIHLLLVESGSHRVIDVVRRTGPMTQETAAGLREDSRKIVDHFVWSGKK